MIVKLGLILTVFLVLPFTYNACYGNLGGRNLAELESLSKDNPLVGSNGTITGNPMSNPSYKTVREIVFISNCISCHNDMKPKGNLNLQTYESAVSSIEALRVLSEHYSRYEEPNPKCNTINMEMMDLVRNWIESGLNP